MLVALSILGGACTYGAAVSTTTSGVVGYGVLAAVCAYVVIVSLFEGE